MKVLRYLPPNVLDRYFAIEMLLPFLFGVGAFTALGTAIGSLFELVNLVAEAGLSMGTAAWLYLLQAPSIIVLTFPMSMLLATLLAYSRLSSDSEMTALRACGISPLRLLIPALMLSLVMTGVTFAFNEAIVPQANATATAVLNAALNRDQPQFREENILYQEFGESEGMQSGLQRLFYARRFDGEQMLGITVLDFSRGGLSQILLAQSAIWQPEAQSWLFRNGTNYIVNEDGSYRNILQFESQEVALSRTPLDVAALNQRPETMNIPELKRYIALQRSTGDTEGVRRLEVLLHQKYAIPFTCVTFAVIGGTLGLRPQRTSSSVGLGLSVLIIFAFYVVSFIAQALGQTGTLGPVIAAWIPNVITVGVGAVLFSRIANR